MTDQDSNVKTPDSRRDFLKKSTSAGAALLATGNYAFGQGTGKLRVGLIGCGGRGSGAAAQALNADSGAVLTAMGDVTMTQIDHSMARQVSRGIRSLQGALGLQHPRSASPGSSRGGSRSSYG